MKKALLVLMGLTVLLPVLALAAGTPEKPSYAPTKPAHGGSNLNQIPDWLKRKVKPLANVKKPVVVRSLS